MGSISEALRVSLPLAVAIAASPGAIIGMIILLMTRRAMTNAYGYLSGWFLGLMLVGIIFLHRPALYGSTGEPSVILGWVRIILGGTIFITGLFMLKKAFSKENVDAPPKWAKNVDSFGFLQAVIVGFFFAAPNVKNASMVSTAAASIGNVGLGFTQEMSVLVLFCLIATLGVLVPPLTFLLFRDKAEHIFGKMKDWLIRYRALILFVICIAFGGLFLYQGFRIVTAF